ncbi:MAG: BON domain-containing protein [Verrucomicrobiota bacterium]
MNTMDTKSDSEIKHDVLSELKYQPSVKETDIGVLVKEGAVTLTGYAESYEDKRQVVLATRRIAGVKAIADELQVRIPHTSLRTDGEIATAAVNQLNWSTTIPTDAVHVTVREGYVTLEGELEWGYQKTAAENATHHLMGIKGVVNLITIKPTLDPANLESAIQKAFERNALLDAKKIHTEISENTVTLRGRVRNHSELEEAERVAWAAPGVFLVNNQLKVDGVWSFKD